MPSVSEAVASFFKRPAFEAQTFTILDFHFILNGAKAGIALDLQNLIG